MPELYFKGKEFVYNHHLTVPFRPLVPDAKKSCGDDAENLIIQGDNLHALKSLLPRYAGKVDLVFIDPPYNTGNEGWAYNDNVNSPLIKEWLSGNPVNGEDMLRHDKWLCMMWPRLKLLHELLSERGSIWITLDDNEVHHARCVLDEIFGAEQFVASLIWKKMDSPSRNEKDRAISSYHDYLLVYAKDAEFTSLSPQIRESILNAYPLRLSDGRLARRRQLRKNGKNARRKDRPTMWYSLDAPDGTEVWPLAPEGWEGRWVLKESEWHDRTKAGLTEWIKRDYGWVPYYIETAPATPSAPWSTIWDDVSQNRQAKAELTEIVGENAEFQTPKPSNLIRRILDVVGVDVRVVLDSFAGSGTTAHAVLAQNAKDDGNRKFILVECEDYADKLTAERVRRVINGYKFTGIQREELLRQKLTFSQLKKAGQILDQVTLLEQQNEDRFDKVKATVKDGELVVTGEKAVTKKTDGLGGGFTYCTLGDKLELDDLLTGKSLPSFEAFGGYLFHTATGQPLDPAKVREADGYLGESAQYHVWLVYRPELDYLKSRDAALTLSLAERIAATANEKPHLVFAPARFVPQKKLLELGVEHAPLPYALYRIERS